MSTGITEQFLMIIRNPSLQTADVFPVVASVPPIFLSFSRRVKLEARAEKTGCSHRLMEPSLITELKPILVTNYHNNC